jgi:hypothetical protein
MLCELDGELLFYSVSFVCSHRSLCLCARTCSKLRKVAKCIAQRRYTDESLVVRGIIEKVRLQECFEFFTRHSPHLECWPTPISVEWLKSRLGWKADGDPSYRNHRSQCSSHNDEILDAFYCDCPRCHRTFPCGRGTTRVMSATEEALLHVHFQANWWESWPGHSGK